MPEQNILGNSAKLLQIRHRSGNGASVQITVLKGQKLMLKE